MSNKEKLLAYAEEMTEADLVFIVNVIEAYKAAERKRREAEEDARDLQIVNEAMARIESGEEELIPLEDVMKELGLTPEDLENEK